MNHLALILLLLAKDIDINYETARFERRLKAVKITERITIDGRMDEPAWSKAPIATNFIQSEPREGEPTSEQTEVRVLYDNDNLYVGFVAHDSELGRLIINELKKDFNRDSGDSFEIVLDTFRDERNGYQFATNPAGAKWDAQMTNEGREMNTNWDGVWYVKTRILEGEWTGEIAIPFKTLKFRHTDLQTWGINFQRNLRRRNEDSFWSPIPRIYGLQRVSLAGTIEDLEGIEPGSNIKLKPYFVTSLAQNAAGKRNYDGEFGFDAKYGLSSGLTWDFTYNTDFSQVEADEQQINLTRFSLFFPEKRDFFLENSGIFQFGTNQRGGGGMGGGGGRGGGGGGMGGGGGVAMGGRMNQLGNDMIFFFSRRIGLSEDGNAIIPILGGTRLTGRAGDYELGFLNIQQREFGRTKPTNFTVGRLRRNILANSDIGVMIANKEVLGTPHFNRVLGADANFRFGQNLNVNSYLVKTSTPAGGSRNLAGRFGFSYNDHFWNVQGSYTDVQENFINEMGFVPRLGMRRYSGYLGMQFRPESIRKKIRSISPHFLIDYVLDRHGNLDIRYIDYHLPFFFQNSSFVEIGINPSLERLSQPFVIERNRNVVIPPGVYKFDEYFILARSDSSRKISANARWTTGRFFTGYKHTYVAGGTFRFNHKLNTSFSYTHNNINLPEGHFKTNLLSTRFNYSFSTIMFLNALIQYNNDARQWSSNIRFNIIHRPLSDLFVVYNERRDSITGNLIDRAIIAKFTYMISR